MRVYVRWLRGHVIRVIGMGWIILFHKSITGQSWGKMVGNFSIGWPSSLRFSDPIGSLFYTQLDRPKWSLNTLRGMGVITIRLARCKKNFNLPRAHKQLQSPQTHTQINPSARWLRYYIHNLYVSVNAFAYVCTSAFLKFVSFCIDIKLYTGEAIFQWMFIFAS